MIVEDKQYPLAPSWRKVDASTKKTCCICRLERPVLTAFYFSKSGKYLYPGSRCKECNSLYRRSRREVAPPCSHPECSLPIVAKALCGMHYQRLKKDGELGGGGKVRSGKGWLNRDGYREVFVKAEGPNETRGRYISQHRHVMEQKLGRRLLPTETVHHVNGDRQDNRIENLELWSSFQPTGQRVLDKVAWAREIIHLYAGLRTDR